MKYLKKVSASQLISNTGTIIDSMNPGDDQTVNAPSIHAVKEYISEKSIVTYKPSADIEYTTPSSYAGTSITNLSVVNSNGNNISLNQNGEFQFANNVKNVKVSYNVCFNNTNTGFTYSVYVIKKHQNTTVSIQKNSLYMNHQYYQNMTIPPVLVPIDSGDTVYIYVELEQANKTLRIKSDCTFVTVEEV